MTDDDIRRMVNEVFIESFEIEPAKIKPEANIFMDLGLDSLDVVDLVVALQNKFNVKIRSDERVRNIRTLADLQNFIIALRNEGAFTQNA
jgi:acyl carrier protein